MKLATKLFSVPAFFGCILLILFTSSSCQKTSSAIAPSLDIINQSNPTAITKQSNPSFTVLNAKEMMFDNVYYAMGSVVYNGDKVAGNGEAVGKIPDKKGTADLIFAGIPQPTITGVPPQLIDDKWLMFDNRPNTNYNSLPVTPISPPFEATLISRNMPGQLFEAKMQNGNNGLYCGDIGSPVRVFDANGNIPNSSKARNYETTIERIVVKQTCVDYWLDGKIVGTFNFTGLPTDAILANTIKKYHSMGTFTNSMDFDFGALYFKAGVFSDAEYADVYASLAAKWTAGTMPNQILLDNIKWVNQNGTYTPSSTVTNIPEGATISDPAQWDYQWFWKDDETNYGKQTLFSTNRVVHTIDFPANDETHHHVSIKYRVRPKDSQGKTWRYFSGTFSDAKQGAQ